MSKAGREWLKAELKKGNGFSRYGVSRANGCRTVEYVHDEVPMPIGVLWYRWTGNTQIDILNVYVTGYARRCGVASAMLKDLLSSYQNQVHTVITGMVNRDSKPWAKSLGFKQDKKTKEWILRVK